MINEKTVGVVIGRFQPVTLEQVNALFVPAVTENKLVVVILGSSDKARDCRDPFTTEERELQITSSMLNVMQSDFLKHWTQQVVYQPVRDYWYNKTRWIKTVQDAVSDSIKDFFGDDIKLSDCVISLYGIDREEEASDYLNNFPTWNNRVIIDNQIQNCYAEIMKDVYTGGMEWKKMVASSLHNQIEDWMRTSLAKDIVEGFEHIKKYRQKYDDLEAQAGHKIQFLTVDNVVLYKGNILLVRRRSHPGKGLWALPGGFLESYETAISGAKRELQEETRLRVNDEWLTGEGRFDHPNRSLRGRTLTHAFKWEIPAWRNVPQLNPEKGFEREVTKVQWFPLSEVITDMADQLFEDHLDIIESLAY